MTVRKMICFLIKNYIVESHPKRYMSYNKVYGVPPMYQRETIPHLQISVGILSYSHVLFYTYIFFLFGFSLLHFG